MREIEKVITPLISSQFPSFYQEEGPLFIAFMEEYYKWLSTETIEIDGENVAGQVLYHSRSLPDYRDIDKTVDSFIIHFKEKYLKGVDFDSKASRRMLVKAAHDIFSAKGSALSFELLFNLVYGVTIEIYTPGDDILKVSDGTWTIPKYLEVVPTSKSPGLAGKLVTGSISGATAFVEYIVTRNINGKMIDLLFLSGITGAFVVGDVVTTDGIFENAPKVLGSYNSINVTAPGEGFAEGEEVFIISSTGVEGKARVSGLESQTGLVRFTLIDGGWGYSTDATVYVSDKNIKLSNIITPNSSVLTFTDFEQVEQNNFSLDLNNVHGAFTVGTYITNPANAISVVLKNVQDSGSNTATITINPISGNPFANTIVYAANQAYITTDNSVSFSVGTALKQRVLTNNTAVGVVTNSESVSVISVNAASIGANGLHVGNYIIQETTLATGVILSIPSESNHNYTNVTSIVVTPMSGTFSNTDVLNTYVSSANVTFVANVTPTSVKTGYHYLLSQVSGTSLWTSNATVLNSSNPTVNTTVLVASDLGGKYNTNVSVKASGTIIGSNTNTIGIINISSTFYSTNNNLLTSSYTGITANVVSISTGTGASFAVGSIGDTEVLLLPTDTLSANNDGPGSNSVPFSTMLINGIDSGYGNVKSVYVLSGGTTYDNTDIVVFTGGNTGAGSYGVGNASLVTDGSGTITSVVLTSNVGNLLVTTPTVSVTNATGGATTGSGADLVPLGHYGFAKNPTFDGTALLGSLFGFTQKTIGTIASIGSINPGSNYNASPFVKVFEPLVSGYGKRDYVAGITNLSKNIGFTVGETVEQSFETNIIITTSNSYSGNTSNNYDIGEQVTTGTGITVTGDGYVRYSNVSSNTYTITLVSSTGSFQNTIAVSSLIVTGNLASFANGHTVTQGSASGIVLDKNTSTVVIKSVIGAFAANATVLTNSNTSATVTITSANNSKKAFELFGNISQSLSDVTDVESNTVTDYARAIVKTGSNTSVLNLKRVTLLSDLASGGLLTGKSSGETANVTFVVDSSSTDVIGKNAIVTAEVVVSNGSISTLDLIDSGLGYLQDETVAITSEDGSRVASGRVSIGGVGTGEGYYSSARGLLDDFEYIQDGEYYQEFSYEVQSSKPLDVYSKILKEVLHVAGTKLFGKVVKSTEVDSSISIAQSTITIT